MPVARVPAAQHPNQFTARAAAAGLKILARLRVTRAGEPAAGRRTALELEYSDATFSFERCITAPRIAVCMLLAQWVRFTGHIIGPDSGQDSGWAFSSEAFLAAF